MLFKGLSGKCRIGIKMALRLLTDLTVQKALENLGDKAYSIRQNLNAMVEDTILDYVANYELKPLNYEPGPLNYEPELFRNSLCSKTMRLNTGPTRDDRLCFKIDHAYDLSKIISTDVPSEGIITIDNWTCVSSYGAIAISDDTYIQSQGTEFIIIREDDIKGAASEYAIRVDKYEDIREQLNQGIYDAEQLEKAGGFKINKWLKPEEISTHDGWKELAVERNNASEQDYKEASNFLEDIFFPFAKEKGCFSDGSDMCFDIDSVEKGVVHSLCIHSLCTHTSDPSYMICAANFSREGNFLTTLDKTT